MCACLYGLYGYSYPYDAQNPYLIQILASGVFFLDISDYPE